MQDAIPLPDAYGLAAYLGFRLGAETIIDIAGSGAAGFALPRDTPPAGSTVVPTLENCRSLFPPQRWITIDAGRGESGSIPHEVASRSVVICPDAADLLSGSSPSRLPAVFEKLASLSPLTIMTVPAKSPIGRAVESPSARSDVSERAVSEFRRLLEQRGIRPTFVGLTVDDSRHLERNVMIAVSDRHALDLACRAPEHFRPLALIATYNDIDIAPQTVGKLLDDGINVHVRDNWSSDGTFERLSALAGARDGLTVRRFPDDGPSRYFDLTATLQWKEQVAAQHPDRWVINQGSDEVRCSPWPQLSYRDGIYLAERMGYSAIDMTVCDFRPVDGAFDVDADPETVLNFFEFGRRPGHFRQVRSWRQGGDRAAFANSGGHETRIAGRKIFPYKFLLKHYPLRSPQQGRRKVFAERRDRFAPNERAMGWHMQYDHWKPDDTFLWDASDLIRFDEPKTRQKYLTEFISGVGLAR